MTMCSYSEQLLSVTKTLNDKERWEIGDIQNSKKNPKILCLVVVEL